MALFRYTFEVKHTGLGKYRIVSGTDESLVRAKAEALETTWNAEFKRKLDKDRVNMNREAARHKLRQNKEQLEENRLAAEELTEEAKAAIEQVTGILHAALSKKHAVNWNKLKRNDSYSKPRPITPRYLEFPYEPQPEQKKYNPTPECPIFLEYPPEPQADNVKYQPVLTWFDKLLESRVKGKNQTAYDLYLQDHAAWEESVKTAEAENRRRAEADAYEFAKGKPLTLMNGANLLYLLEKHGRKAKIDIREAKRILGEKES